MGVLGQSRDTGAAGVIAPLSGPVDRTGFFSNIGPGFRQAVAGPHSTRVGEAIYEQKIYDDVVNALSAEGEQGEDLLTITASPTRVKRKFRNPYVSGPGQNLLNPTYNPLTSLYGGGDRREIDQIWGAVKRVHQRKPDFLKAFPDEGSLKAFALQRRQKEIAASQAVTERASTAGSVGGFIGSMGGSLASMDPENVVGGGFGTAAGKTFARTVVKRAVESAGANAAAAMVGVPGMEEDAKRLGQEMTTEDAVHQVGVAAGLGAAFGVAHVAIPKAAEGARAVVGKVAENLPAPVRDALVAASIRAGTVQDRSLLGEWIRTHQPGGIIDTATPDERAAAHTVTRDIENREASPLKPEDAHHNEARLGAIAHSLGVSLSTPEIPTPVQQPTVRSGGPRRAASYEEAVHTAEGTGKNPDSSADGHFQFTEGTWLEYAPRIADTKGMSRQQILALRHDRPTAERAERLFRADNSRYLRERGIEDSPGNLSLAHFLGRSDAAKVLNADPSTPVERLVDPASLRANRKVLAGKSASEVVAWAHRRIGTATQGPVARAEAVADFDYGEVPPHEIASLSPDEVSTNAELMQYKSGGDTEGVTGKLRDVTAWNPLMSSEILVWQPKEGGHIVVDGHQRVGLAKRLNDPDIRLPSIVLREADGITAAQARTLGALRNINLGTGTLEDNARILRDAPEAADLIRGAEHRRGIEGLARLNYEAFGAVLNNVIDPRVAAQIGIHAGHAPDSHMAMVDLLRSIHSPGEAASVVRQALADGFGTAPGEQLSLLGQEAQQSLYVPISRILAAAGKRLREEKRTFRTLAEKAGRIEEAGNVLDRAANEGRIIDSDEALAILNATAYSSGPVRDALIAAARAELSGARRGDAVNQFLDALSGIDLRSAAAGDGAGGRLGELTGAERGGDALEAPSDELVGGHGSLFDQAVAARAEAEPFSDPVGEAAKAQTDIIDHDLLMDAVVYHGGFGVEGEIHTPFYVSPDRSVAETYASDRGGGAGRTEAFRLTARRIATEDDIRVAAKAVGLTDNEIHQLGGMLFDPGFNDRAPELVETLRKDGFDAAKFTDFAVDSDTPSLTYAVLDPAAISRAVVPPSLFDLPETGYRLSEEGDPKPIQTIMQDAEADEIAAKNATDCLKPGEA